MAILFSSKKFHNFFVLLLCAVVAIGAFFIWQKYNPSSVLEPINLGPKECQGREKISTNAETRLYLNVSKCFDDTLSVGIKKIVPYTSSDIQNHTAKGYRVDLAFQEVDVSFSPDEEGKYTIKQDGMNSLPLEYVITDTDGSTWVDVRFQP